MTSISIKLPRCKIIERTVIQLAQTRVCKVPDGVHKRVQAIADERGISFPAALEVLLERGESAISELEARGYRPRSGASALPTSSNPARGFGNSVQGNLERRGVAIQSRSGRSISL